MSPERPRRVAVIGTSGAGKTTFARHVSERLGLDHVELDALFWLPGWIEPETRGSERRGPRESGVTNTSHSRAETWTSSRAPTSRRIVATRFRSSSHASTLCVLR